MSVKQYRQIFSDATGLKPKEYSRLVRFQSALRRLRREDNRLVTEVAVDCNYFDQAHFGHEFKALSGMTPTAYSSVEGEHSACLFTHIKKIGQQLVRGRTARASAPEPIAPQHQQGQS